MRDAAGEHVKNLGEFHYFLFYCAISLALGVVFFYCVISLVPVQLEITYNNEVTQNSPHANWLQL